MPVSFESYPGRTRIYFWANRTWINSGLYFCFWFLHSWGFKHGTLAQNISGLGAPGEVAFVCILGILATMVTFWRMENQLEAFPQLVSQGMCTLAVLGTLSARQLGQRQDPLGDIRGLHTAAQSTLQTWKKNTWLSSYWRPTRWHDMTKAVLGLWPRSTQFISPPASRTEATQVSNSEAVTWESPSVCRFTFKHNTFHQFSPAFTSSSWHGFLI